MIEQGGPVHNFGDLWSVILDGIAEANMPLGLGCVELQFFGETRTPPSPLGNTFSLWQGKGATFCLFSSMKWTKTNSFSAPTAQTSPQSNGLKEFKCPYFNNLVS